MTDQDFLQYFNSINKRHTDKILKEKEEVYKFYLNRYKENDTIKEVVYRLRNNLEEKPKCPICGQDAKFDYNKNHYIKCCENRQCQILYNKKKVKESFIKKYGVTNASKLSSHKEKTKRTWKSHSKEYKEDIVSRTQITCLERYGVTNKAKLDSTIKKMEKTNLEKYGYVCSLRNKIVIEKCKHTSKKKYGVEFPSQSTEIKSKIFNTKKRNHSFGPISKTENLAYMYLSLEYPDTIRQYTDENRYPFNCDFYIPCLDLFIECNFHWTHNNHIFNQFSKEDQKILYDLQHKESKYYKNAIITWTIRDPLKYKVAKENKLNYKIFWNLEELINWLK